MSSYTENNLIKENDKLKKENEWLKAAYLKVKRAHFSPKSERIEDNRQLLFNEIEWESPEAPPEQERITYTRSKGRGKKKPIPENIDREETVIDLEESEKTCPHDGTQLRLIGEEITEKLKSYPARHLVSVIRKKKYACPQCEGYMAQAKYESILPGTIATPEILSFIIFSKFFQSLPLYRLEELYKLNGIELSRGTMARWLVKISEKLMPIWNLLEEKAFETGYLTIDATPVQVLKEKGRAPQTKSSMWARGSPELGIILFDYDVSGGGKVAKKLTCGFKGALQADAHRGYGALDKVDLILLGCLMHSRRRFYNAWVAAKKDKESIAYQGLKYLQWVYHKEEQYKKRGLTPEQRKEIRDQEMRPAMKQIKEWCDGEIPKVPKSSDIGNALNYYVNEYNELIGFLENGRYEVDNGWIERQIKRFAIGRKNWMFADTVEGANASGLLYSLTLTAKLNGKDPFQVMTQILTELPKANTLEDYEKLTELLLSEHNPNSCRKKEGALIH